MTIIDVHTHYIAGALVDALERRTDLPRVSDGQDGKLIEYGEGNGHPMQDDMRDIALRLRDMDEQGIDAAVVSTNVPGVDWFPAADAPSIARDVNDELLDLARRYPDRIAVQAVLPLQAPEAAAEELERTAGAGAVAAMIFSNVAGVPLDDPRFGVVFDTAARLDIPLYVHPTYPLTAKTLDAYALISTVGFLVDTTTAVLRLVLGGLYERHPDFKLVLAHSASLLPQLVGRIDYEAARLPNGTGKLTVAPSEALARIYTDCVCVWPPALRSTLDFLGPERVMFGSDYPFWDPARSLASLRDAGLPRGVVETIQAGNARRLFGLGDALAAEAPSAQRENPPA